MRNSPPKNIAASIRQRLLNMARSEKRPFSELLQYYAMERFLYRLSCSPFQNQYILKGALMLRIWESPLIRPTMDIDMLGQTSNDLTHIESHIKQILSVKVEADGLEFDSQSIRSERITEEANYEGARIKFKCQLGNAKINMQIDIGFDDIIYPEPTRKALPTLLDSPEPMLLCYSRESAIAEKLEAMVKLGTLNSRMKDFYDIWLLSRQFDFNGGHLAKSIRLTFEHRGTKLPENIDAFSDTFMQDKQIQWIAFTKRLEQAHVPKGLSEIIIAISSFIEPITYSIVTANPPPEIWIAPGPWRD